MLFRDNLTATPVPFYSIVKNFHKKFHNFTLKRAFHGFNFTIHSDIFACNDYAKNVTFQPRTVFSLYSIT